MTYFVQVTRREKFSKDVQAETRVLEFTFSECEWPWFKHQLAILFIGLTEREKS